MKRIIALLGLLNLATPAFADDLWLGTWVQRGATPMTMTIQKLGAGRRQVHVSHAARIHAGIW